MIEFLDMPGNSKEWYVHVNNETLGPLVNEEVVLFLQQKRLQFVDFIWSAEHTRWKRIEEIDEFKLLMPIYPKCPLPTPEERAKIPAPVTSVPPVEQKLLTPKAARDTAEEEKWKAVRRFVRAPSSGEKVTLGDYGDFEVLNISTGGFFLASHSPPPVGTEVSFSLDLKKISKKLDMNGIVIRHGKDMGRVGFAVEFTRLNPAHKRALEAYIGG